MAGIFTPTVDVETEAWAAPGSATSTVKIWGWRIDCPWPKFSVIETTAMRSLALEDGYTLGLIISNMSVCLPYHPLPWSLAMRFMASISISILSGFVM
ncbi:hypothetical protein, partial [Novosphingobium cyanobacteriorum]